MAVGSLGISPSEFWKMKPRHFWWLVESEAEKNGKAPTKGLSASEAKRLRKMAEVHNATQSNG